MKKFFHLKSKLTCIEIASDLTFRWFGISIFIIQKWEKIQNMYDQICLSIFSIVFNIFLRKKSPIKKLIQPTMKDHISIYEKWIARGNGNLYFSSIQWIFTCTDSWWIEHKQSNISRLSAWTFFYVWYFTRVNICDFAKLEKKSTSGIFLFKIFISSSSS